MTFSSGAPASVVSLLSLRHRASAGTPVCGRESVFREPSFVRLHRGAERASGHAALLCFLLCARSL